MQLILSQVKTIMKRQERMRYLFSILIFNFFKLILVTFLSPVFLLLFLFSFFFFFFILSLVDRDW